MPIYEYSCIDCGKTTEVLMKTGDEAARCGACGGDNLKKRLSAPAAYSSQAKDRAPGPGDTTCCGGTPGDGSCAGPGSCCGRM